MRLLTDNKPKETLDRKLEKCAKYISNYFKELSGIQEMVCSRLNKELGQQGLMDHSMLAKFIRLTSTFAQLQSERMKTNYREILAIFTVWRKMLTSGEIKKSMPSDVPAQLAACFFMNGDYYKALLCLSDYATMTSDETAREEIIKWSLYLGEWEMVENHLEQLKNLSKGKPSEEYIAIAKTYMEYNRVQKTRSETALKLVDLYQNAKKSPEATFSNYGMQSFLSWVASTLSSVENVNPQVPDSLSSIESASFKAESIMRNRARSLSVYYNDSDILRIDDIFAKKSHAPSEYVRISSSFAWLLEMRREFALTQLQCAQPREALATMLLTWNCVLRTSIHFRMVQVMNSVALLHYLCPDSDCEQMNVAVRNSTLNLLATNPELVRCVTPVQRDDEALYNTTLGSARDSIDTLKDAFEDVSINESSSIHLPEDGCICYICQFYYSNYNFASEHLLSQAIYDRFSKYTTDVIEKEFHEVRTRVSTDQCAILRKAVRPRPPVILCDVLGQVVSSWMLKVETDSVDDEESSRIVATAIKTTKYTLRTFAHAITIRQLHRQIVSPFSADFNWMQIVTPRQSRIRMGITCAKDVIRAVSPFGQRIAPSVMKRVRDAGVDRRSIAAACKDFRSMRHCLYRDWRFNICAYVGRTAPDRWLAALAWAESTVIGTRCQQQQALGKVDRVVFSSENLFQKEVQKLPKEITLVQLAVSEDGCLYLVKLHCDREPLVIPISHPSKVDEMMEKFCLMLAEDEKIARTSQNMTAEKFWDTRRAIDARLKSFFPEVENHLLGDAAAFLLPSTTIGNEFKALVNEIVKCDNRISESDAKELIGLMLSTEEIEWKKATRRICEIRGVDARKMNKLFGLYPACAEKVRRVVKRNVNENLQYTFLVVSPEVSQFPWEQLPVFERHPYVSRVASIHAFFLLMNSGQTMPRQIDVNKSYYVLDPDNNLGETKKRIVEYMTKFPWKGVIGGSPSNEDIVQALQHMDMFFYFGHGSGSRHLSRRTIKQTKCNAVSVLMGCGSVRTVPHGRGFDGRSVVYDYALAKCPLIVGCLWTVTDGEIDRYLMRMVDACFTPAAQDGLQRLRVIAEAMKEAQNHCKLKYLTGAAVVTYGLPVVAKLESLSSTQPPVSGRTRRQQKLA